METNIVVDISPPIPHLAKFWFSSYEPKCWQPMKLQDSLKCNISRKKWMMKFVFGMQINIEVFYKLILSFWVCPTRLAQSTQNKNFAYLCNISRKARRGGGGGGGEGWVKLIFCLQINTKVFFKLMERIEWWSWFFRMQISLLQIYIMILMVMVKHSQTSHVDIFHGDKHQSFLKVYFSTLGIKVSYKFHTIIINGHDQAFSNYSK